MTADWVERDPEDDFLSFWRQQRAKTTAEVKHILGVDVPVPTELPMAVVDRAEYLQTSQDPREVERVVEMIFGPDVYATWKDHGITVPMLEVLVTWGITNGTGRRVTFEEAAEISEQAKVAAGKAESPNGPVPVRGLPSVGTGALSSRTSAESTGSAQRRYQI